MKKVFKFLVTVFCCLITMVTVACSGSKTKYEFTHENGNVSSFTIDFEKLTASYEGYPMWSVLMNGRNYKKCSGATEKCDGTLEKNENNGVVFYEFISNSNTRWSVTIFVSDDKEAIRVSINGTSYTFRKS